MAQDRMQRQRFEFKYLVSEATALDLRALISSHLALDEASVEQPNYSYRVSSLYLDSEELYTFWDWVNANRNRFKLRLRFYDAGPETPVFLEIKRRVCGCILKQRCGLRKSAASTVLVGQVPPRSSLASSDPKQLVALETFLNLASVLQARPKALVTYLREAYVDPENENVRLTLDRQVRIALCPEVAFNLSLQPYVQPFGDRVILELKFNNRFPSWFNDMVQQFGLTRGAAAKYCEGIAALLYPEHANSLTHPVDSPIVGANPGLVLKPTEQSPASTPAGEPPLQAALPTALAETRWPDRPHSPCRPESKPPISVDPL